MKTLYLILLPILLFSCQNNGEKHIEQLVEEWNNKKIQFPNEPVFTRFVADTVPFELPLSEHKVVVFVDSVGCMSCKLQLAKWRAFMHEVDSLSRGSVPFLFFFQSKDLKELKNILRRDDFSHPVCIDTADSFNSLNRFPREMMFQTFLLDGNNRVQVIGNPIHNLSVRDLYLKEIGGIEAKSLPVTTIRADSTEYHYGAVGRHATASKSIILHNTGKEVFHIKGVAASCDCMRVDYDWHEIHPGGKAVMTVHYKAEEAGEFWRTLTIYGNIPEQSVTLDFWGTVTSDK